MHLIVCIEENDGMSFCGRRLSSDRVVADHIAQLTAGKVLWMSGYSADLFPGRQIKTDPDFLKKAGAGEWCFVENTPLGADLKNLESVLLYHWNRRYPSTQRFPRQLLAGKTLQETVEFSGHSHEKITLERYA